MDKRVTDRHDDAGVKVFPAAAGSDNKLALRARRAGHGMIRVRPGPPNFVVFINSHPWRIDIGRIQARPRRKVIPRPNLDLPELRDRRRHRHGIGGRPLEGSPIHGPHRIGIVHIRLTGRVYEARERISELDFLRSNLNAVPVDSVGSDSQIIIARAPVQLNPVIGDDKDTQARRRRGGRVGGPREDRDRPAHVVGVRQAEELAVISGRGRNIQCRRSHMGRVKDTGIERLVILEQAEKTFVLSVCVLVAEWFVSVQFQSIVSPS